MTNLEKDRLLQMINSRNLHDLNLAGLMLNKFKDEYWFNNYWYKLAFDSYWRDNSFVRSEYIKLLENFKSVFLKGELK